MFGFFKIISSLLAIFWVLVLLAEDKQVAQPSNIRVQLGRAQVVCPNTPIHPKDSTLLYAYVSVGEKTLNSNDLLNKKITHLWQKGYRGFFLDKLDAWQALNLTKKQQIAEINRISHFIKSIKTHYPKAHLIINRGFGLLPQVQDKVDALAAESLYSGFNENTKQYVDILMTQRQMLLRALNKAQHDYHLPIIVIDYAQETEKVKKIANSIAGFGFIPWVISKPIANCL